jgi:hypothetical protein
MLSPAYLVTNSTSHRKNFLHFSSGSKKLQAMGRSIFGDRPMVESRGRAIALGLPSALGLPKRILGWRRCERFA